ncbi:MAG: metal-dependent transcriptional regulator [Planctomycetota bacterium]|jgi:DtxR family Mn-dependent transcriptional regulator
MSELSDRSEEILEQLWILIEERGLHPGSDVLRDDDALTSLCERGLVELREHEAVLTEEGREQARRCVRRHRLAERLLADVLDSGAEDIHRAGCKFEHGLHAGLEERVCTILGHPRACPHGKSIPRGECCRRLESQTGPLLSTAAELTADEPATIAYLHSERPAEAIGALPGAAIVVRQRFPSFLIELDGSQFGIDEEMARQIHVRRSGQAAPVRKGR